MFDSKKLICEQCGSENTKWETVRRNDHFLTILQCKDCGYERLPTAEERDNFN
jgi:uncharacterized Zn finger protein